MLRAIAGYILGGILNDPPQENMDCDTQEVNDWLVVNMPNKLDESDLDFESDAESEIDEDDILACLPMLLTVEELEYTKSVDKQLSIINTPRASLTPEDIMSDCSILQYTSVTAQNENELLPYDIDVCLQRKKKYCPLMITHPIDQNAWNHKLNGAQICQLWQRVRDLRDKKSKKTNNSQPTELTCNHVQAPTYVNHRPPLASAKTDLLQQIKEIEPSQKAKEFALKKHINRSQLNRQNKNYIYTTSAKTNRRKDLQKNHSGANNNRKCY